MTSKRVAVVTGSNKGIGFGIVKELCAKFEGVVYLTSRNESRGIAAVKELEILGFYPKFHQLDIDDETSVIQFRDHLKETYGGLDVLVNNAAIAFKSDSTEPIEKQVTLTLRTNFFNTLKVCSILFPILKPHARVVNVSSAAGHLLQITNKEKPGVELKAKLSSDNLTEYELSKLMHGYVEAAINGQDEALGWPTGCYGVSKLGVCALSRIQQRQFNQDAREDLIVNTVHPGWVDTDMTRHRGILKIEEAAVAPSWLALLPKNIEGPKGGFVWYDKKIVDWIHGPMPPSLRPSKK